MSIENEKDDAFRAALTGTRLVQPETAETPSRFDGMAAKLANIGGEVAGFAIDGLHTGLQSAVSRFFGEPITPEQSTTHEDKAREEQGRDR
jgi:hypothetical protein